MRVRGVSALQTTSRTADIENRQCDCKIKRDKVKSCFGRWNLEVITDIFALKFSAEQEIYGMKTDNICPKRLYKNGDHPRL